MTLEEQRERLVSHIVRMAQVDADYARHAARAYATMENCPWPDLIQRVKARIDELGIELPPKQPEPWYMVVVNNRGDRMKPRSS